jgi:CrcB protein
MILLMVAIGGAIGSVLRYIVHIKIDQMHSFDFPLGILSINIIGSFLMGLLAWLLTVQIQLPEAQRMGILVGILGGFTTFSTFSMNTLQMIMDGHYFTALSNIVLSVVLCIMAAGLGLYTAKSF